MVQGLHHVDGAVVMRWLPLLLLLSAPLAWGQTSDTCPQGQLSAAQAATGASTDTFLPLGTDSIVIQFVRDDGDAVGQVEVCCTDNCAAAGDWAIVAGSSRTVDATTTTEAVGITEPACTYRTNLTTCNGPCDIDIFARCGRSR